MTINTSLRQKAQIFATALNYKYNTINKHLVFTK